LKVKLGCFTRPYGEHTLERALKGISSAGFGYVGLMHPGMLTPNMARAEIEQLRKTLRLGNLIPLATWGGLKADEPGIFDFKSVIDIAQEVGVKTILTAGPWPYLEGIIVKKPTRQWMKEIDEFYRAIQAISGYAASRGVEIAFKPHAGITGTAKECLEMMERIDSKSIRIWYDPGNVVFYEGLRPEDTPDDLQVIVDYVTGLCAKDIVGGRGGDLAAPGEGRIDFKEIFKVLQAAGFEGPCLVETAVPEATPPEKIDALLKSSYEYLRNIVEQL
jgi:sugar phosphate isomerase/epimerase